jgi:Tfp pilus assembly protein PilF
MSSGLAGIAAFAALLTGFVRLARRRLQNNRDQWQKTIWAALAAGVAGHLVDLQFGFELTASATIFWLALALGASLDRTRTPSTTAEPALSSQALLLYVPPTLAVLVLIVLLCVRPLVADAAYQQSLQDAQSPEAAQRAVHLWSMEPTYRLQLATTLANNRDPAAQAQLNTANALSPNDPQVWAATGSIYAQWGNVSPDKYTQAEASYRRALELAPDIATYHTALGLILIQQGKVEDGLIELERAVDLDVTDGVAFHHLARVYEALGEKSKATWAHKEAERWLTSEANARMDEYTN